jgi:hypothetical protein
MSHLRAHVENGRLVLNEPTALPDGTVLHLVMDDEGDDMNDEEREALDRVLLASFESAKTGALRPASDLLDDLRHQR